MLQTLQTSFDEAIVAGGVPATTSVLGLNRMSVAPVDPAVPIAVGDNDPRLLDASETVKGSAQEATDAEVTAGTATGSTGAKLFVTPAKLATRLTEVIYSPVFQQNIGTSVTETLDVNGYFKAAGSNADGSVLIATFSGITDALYRFERDSLTGQYLQTHRVIIGASGQLRDSRHGSIVVIGNFAYLFSIPTSNNVFVFRYNLADLTSETTITVPTLVANAYVVVWTNGTDVYLISSSSSTTSRLWTLSGTTFTAGATAAITSPMGGITLNFSTFWDGANAFIVGTSTSTDYPFIIRKLTSINASAFSETTRQYPRFSDNERQFIACNVDSTRMYMGGISFNYDETGIIGSQLRLVPITKP